MCSEFCRSDYIFIPVFCPERAKKFKFSTPLPPSYKAEVGKDAQLECFINDKSAKVEWKVDGKPIKVSCSFPLKRSVALV